MIIIIVIIMIVIIDTVIIMIMIMIIIIIIAETRTASRDYYPAGVVDEFREEYKGRESSDASTRPEKSLDEL